MRTPASTKANQGKSAEKLVKEWLEAYNAQHMNFDWKRNYDSHSARAYLPAQTYDFEWYMPGLHGGFEVKEMKHDYRLPHGSFNTNQVNRLRKRRNAGGCCWVVTRHTESELWRCIPVEFFYEREGGSWDLRKYGTFETLGEAISTIGVFE